MATDEEILARTLSHPFTRDGEGNIEQPDRLYRPYSLGPAGQPVSIVFRDQVLSDLIGFTYASWLAGCWGARSRCERGGGGRCSRVIQGSPWY